MSCLGKLNWDVVTGYKVKWVGTVWL